METCLSLDPYHLLYSRIIEKENKTIVFSLDTRHYFRNFGPCTVVVQCNKMEKKTVKVGKAQTHNIEI